MDFRFKILALLFLVLFFTKPSFSAERYEFFNGVRSLGMGGTQVAVVNDETALLGNPAALGRLRDYFITVADPELELGENTQRIVDADITAFLDPQEVLDKLKLQPAYRLYERAQVFPSFVVTNFGMGLYGNYMTSASMNTAVTEMDLFYRNDMAFVFGFNFRLFDGRIKIGVNAKAISRIEIDNDAVPAASTNLTVQNMANGGFGIGSDVGLIMTGPWVFLPTLAAVYRDVGNTSYTMGDPLLGDVDSTTPPEKTKSSLDVGLSIQPIIGKGNRMTLSAELKDVMANIEPEAEDDISRRMHYGLEFNFKDAIFFRGGLNQGYWTAGMEIAMFNYQLQLATYGEEVGTKDSEQEDRRYVAKFAWRF